MVIVDQHSNATARTRARAIQLLCTKMACGWSRVMLQWACAFSTSPYMQTYLSLRNNAYVYVYMSAYADICLHMQTSRADLCMSDREIISLRLARHTRVWHTVV